MLKGESSGDGSVHEVSVTSPQGSGQSNMPVVALVGVIFLVGLVGFGYFRASILDCFKK